MMNSSKRRLRALRVLAVMAAVLIGLSACSEAVFTVELGGFRLKYPKKWKDKVEISVEDDRACFASGGQKLFDIVLGAGEGFVLGTVTEDEYTVFSVVDYAIESENEELFAMQEDINVILEHLGKDYDFVYGDALEKEDNSTFDVETPVVTMKYPAKWKDRVTIEVSDSCVKFSSEGNPLFDLVFSECDGFLLGTYNKTPIYIVDYPVEGDELAAMQEDVNVILENLMKDPAFKINM